MVPLPLIVFDVNETLLDFRTEYRWQLLGALVVLGLRLAPLAAAVAVRINLE